MDRIQNLLQALKQNDSDPFLRYAIAIEYKNENQLELSRRYFDDLLTLFPDYVPQFYHHGKLLEDLGEESKAAGMYRLGITAAQNANDGHALSEIQAALNLLEDDF